MAHWREFLDPSAPSGAYLPWKEVARRTSLSRTTAWRLQRRDEFPCPYLISPGRVGHLEGEVEAWMASRARAGAAKSLPTQKAAVAPCNHSARRATPPQALPGQPASSDNAERPAAPPQALRIAQANRRTRRDRRTVGVASQQITFNF